MLNSSFRPLAALLSVAAIAGAATALPAHAATTTTVGEHPTLVLLVNYSDRPVQTMTREAAHAMVFGEANDALWEYSYGRFTLTGDVAGWFTVPVASTVCNPQLVAQEADKAATAAGVDLSKYQHKIYLAPGNVCQGTGYNGGITLPTRTNLFNDTIKTENVVHEFGHNLGLSHAQSLDCGAVTLNPDATACDVNSYGDSADVMGNGHLSQFSAAQKEKLGWLTASGTQQVKTVTASGRYRIERLEDGSGIKALKIAREMEQFSGAMNYYFVEYRQPIGHDAPLASVGNLTKGVLVHIGGVNQSTRLLDTTPGSQSTSGSDIRDGALEAGRSYRDDVANVTISVVSTDTTGATIDVTIGTAVPPPSSEPPPSGGTLTDSVGTDKSIYARSETVAMSALVKRDGIAVAGATVQFAITTPTGTANVNATTGSDGFARATYRIGKAKNAVGTYTLRANASSNGDTASSSASFTVR